MISPTLPPLPEGTLENLHKANQRWEALRHGNIPVPEVVTTAKEELRTIEWDVVISGGTLGILLGATLQNRGWRVALMERGLLRGRDQEWNISRQELQTFLDLDLLTEAELESAIATEYNPARVSFHGGKDIWVEDVLNIGVDPVYLLDTLKNKFLAAGGTLLENTPFNAAVVHPNGVQVQAGETTLHTRLLIDAMGNFSPIVLQARKGEKPEGVCLVVGSCAQGYPENETGDLLVSFTPILHQCQYFWEAFPAKDGRTTYLFTYLDADPQRPSLEFFFEEYLRLLPDYQKVELSELDFQRVLFGFFPSYQKSPLHLPWGRILPVGDSSGGQSPVSFGGFGSMVRHLKRLTIGIQEALEADTLSKNALNLLQPYQPNIAVTWLFQRAMSVGVDQDPDPDQINRLLNGVFAAMEGMGEEVLKPFLQDVVQFSTLSKTLPQVKPNLVLPIIPQVGLPTLIDWLRHYAGLTAYSGLFQVGSAIAPFIKNLSPQQQYYYHRLLEAWKYGAGHDYHG
jgi:lycopene cyclase CruP